MTPDGHPAQAVDAAHAASTFAASLDGSGPFWDPVAVATRPDLHGDLAAAGRDVLATIRRDLRDLIPCPYRGRSLRHPEARTAIARWCALRAEEKRLELIALPLEACGAIRLQRVIAAHPSALRASLGIYWSSDLGHGGILSAPWKTTDDPEMVVTARVHPADVDWQATCLARMDLHSGDYEKEVRLHPGRPLLGVRASTWDQSLMPERSMPIDLPALTWTS